MATTEESEYLDLHNTYKAKYEAEEASAAQDFTFVQESGVLLKYIEVLVSHSQGTATDHSEKEVFEVRNRVVHVIQQYQEQPGLLDPHLEAWTVRLMAGVRSGVLQGGKLGFLLDVVYTLCKVRGQETLVKFFPHETQDLEPVFAHVLKFDPKALAEWQELYVMLIWLSIIVLAPFDLDTIDSSGTLVERLICLCKTHMGSTSRVKEAVAVLLSKLLTRPDLLRAGLLERYFHWCLEQIPTADSFMRIGILLSIVEVFAQAQRSDLQPFLPLLASVMDLEESNMTIRHLKVKLASRLSMTQLRPIVAAWRYQRGGRQLTKVLLEGQQTTPMLSNCQSVSLKSLSKGAEASQPDIEMDEDVDLGILEKIIDTLLQGLRDRDTIVRWAAAKGVGRLTGRLSKELGDEVVEQVIGLFSVTEPDSSWHGGCLALGELVRRGLLLPSRLSQVFPLLFEALFYDKKQGNHSVGVHVRDAACYLAWSFARAYAPSDLAKFLHDLSANLLIVCCYDREVNCRRAASAAFQEHVGRQGSFAHGIEILTEADYFTLGSRTNAYLQVSCFVAQFDVYLPALINHLLRIKLFHWDPVIRHLSACGLSVLVPFNPALFVSVVLPELVSKTTDVNLLTRHGAILGVAEVLLGFAGLSGLNSDPKSIEKMVYKHAASYYQLLYQEGEAEKDKVVLQDSARRAEFKALYKTLQDISHMGEVPLEALLSAVAVVFNVEKNRLYRGKGGQIVRTAVCRLIECIAKVKIGLAQPQVKKLQESLNDHIIHIAEDVQVAAAAALYAFSRAYHTDYQLYEETLGAYTSQLRGFLGGKEVPANVTRGSALAIGCLEAAVLRSEVSTWLDVLGGLLVPKNTDSDDAETRRNAATSLGTAVVTLLDAGASPDLGIQAIHLLFRGLEDYSVDKRGDVGSWVRAAAMAAIEGICAHVEVPEEMWLQVVQRLLQQLCEKIDKVRQVAGVLLEGLVSKRTLPERAEVLRAVFVDNQAAVDAYLNKLEQETGSVQLPDLSDLPAVSTVAAYRRASLWSIPGFVFSLVTPLLSCPEFREAILRGIVVSAGGITESTMKSASQSLVMYMRNAAPEVVWCLLRIYKEGQERLLVPFMKTWELLLRECREVALLPGLATELYQHTKTVMTGCKDISRWQSAVALYSALLDSPDTQHTALTSLVTLLAHGFPKVRSQSAQALYNFLIALPNHCGFAQSQEELDRAAEILIESAWAQSLKEVKPLREEVARLLGITIVQAESRKEEASKQEEKSENYAELVKEMGY